MPRIRKKTSNRSSTNDRRKLHNRIRKSTKKKAKAAKKSTQWKSKKKQDPGIPNQFPYKDQILAEIAEERRRAAEDKQRRKDEKRLAKTQNEAAENEGSDDEDAAADGQVKDANDAGFDGIASLSAKHLIRAKAKGKEPDAKAVVEEVEEVPILVNRDLPHLEAVLHDSDVVFEVLDARDPLAFRSRHLEEFVLEKKKRLVFVLTKIDKCPREAVFAWASQLRAEHPTLLFRAASSCLESAVVTANTKGKGKAVERVDDALGADAILDCLGKWAKEKGGKSLAVSVVGVTNAGKSSLVNSLLKTSVLPVYNLSSSSRGPTTTLYAQEVPLEVAGSQIRMIDTPGLSWERAEMASDPEGSRIRDILLRSKGRIDRLKDPGPVVASIISRSETEDLMLLYNLPAFAKGDPDAFLAGVARSNQLVRKRGVLDLAGASRLVLRDWSTGKFPRYAVPPKNSTDDQVADKDSFAEVYAKDDVVLAALRPRKEMRKAGNLVRCTAGEVDTRKVALQEPWAGGEGGDGDSDSASENDDDQDVEMDENEEVDDESDDDPTDEDAEPSSHLPPPISNKQKRKRATEAEPTPPNKKVAFAAHPKGTKQARIEGSKKGLAAKEKAAPKVAAPPPKAKKIANGGKLKATTKAKEGPVTSGEEVYDFGKFF